MKRRNRILTASAVGLVLLAVPGVAALRLTMGLPFLALKGAKMDGVTMIPGPAAPASSAPYTAQRSYHLHTEEDVLNLVREELNEMPCYRIMRHDQESIYLHHPSACPMRHDSRDHTILIWGRPGEYVIQYVLRGADPNLAERASIAVTRQPADTYGYQREYWTLRKDF